MSATQRGPPRRLSARLQEKDDAPVAAQSAQQPPATQISTQNETTRDRPREALPKKRKNAYDEEDDGFTFSRVKKKTKQKETSVASVPEQEKRNAEPISTSSKTVSVPVQDNSDKAPMKQRRKKMSFSTPNTKDEAPVRRSKRLSDEHDARSGSPIARARRKQARIDVPTAEDQIIAPKQREKTQTEPEAWQDQGIQKDQNSDKGHAPTKIALPVSDTPVIQRNKAMRDTKSGKGERRSSLGMRGRRASSLIESGNSSALPHSEVEIADYFKHIESDGLPEPRRMRQLLTWCATKSLDQKPLGAGFEDASAIAAARVIEEELLKDLSNKSELCDWFAREDVPVQTKPLPERPHPKNEQNAGKIVELEEQIKRLRAEKDALESLLKPPATPAVDQPDLANIDRGILNDSDAEVLKSLRSSNDISANISTRLTTLQQNLQPTIDAFADGVHKLCQYRDAAENVAGRVLSICSEKLTEREKEGRRRAAASGSESSPRRDLDSVLRGLSRVDR